MIKINDIRSVYNRICGDILGWDTSYLTTMQRNIILRAIRLYPDLRFWEEFFKQVIYLYARGELYIDKPTMCNILQVDNIHRIVREMNKHEG